MEIEFDVGAREARAADAYARNRRRRLTTRGGIFAAVQLAAAVPMGLSVGCILIALRAPASEMQAWANGAVLLALLACVPAVVAERLRRRRLEALRTGAGLRYPTRRKLVVSGRGLCVSEAMIETHVSWRFIDAVEPHGDHVAVALADGRCLLVPKAAIGTEEDVQDFIDIVEEKRRD